MSYQVVYGKSEYGGPDSKNVIHRDPDLKKGRQIQNLKFRWLKVCRDRPYGANKLLKQRMKEIGINTEVNGKYSKYAIMGAALSITPKTWINSHTQNYSGQTYITWMEPIP
ncbi:unnamed protein product (macronuclear) [Paramecium tetraurelia]|uniref:Uncharacterized protein n=1 Tax=Paramecium tetraurelia TaxID=5888 RepID=A0BJV6_PARTE|nr:uncharacterized protein GSPATT00029453001 [Paramecium tetraurelia]CAK58823.1 unnamed protein product [Paramecium tetraurelia]|eukprot:XP_001426221.1 hypothetical protein (macronuclear) [Paramecium tetraurelia strain d4-2]